MRFLGFSRNKQSQQPLGIQKWVKKQLEAKIASRRYDVYKNITWVNAKESHEVQAEIKANKDSIKLDLYACVIHTKGKYFDVKKTLGHIPREISR